MYLSIYTIVYISYVFSFGISSTNRRLQCEGNRPFIEGTVFLYLLLNRCHAFISINSVVFSFPLHFSKIMVQLPKELIAQKKKLCYTDMPLCFSS